MEEAGIILQLVLIVVLGGTAQWLAWRFRLPSILLLLLFGFLAGPVFSYVKPDKLLGDLLLPLVSLSVAVILFEGGLTLNFRELRTTGHVVRNLVTIGAIVTWVIGAAAAWYILGLDARLAILVGALLVVTGPTVILPLLRHIRPSGSVGALLKWEGIVIDPVGALLTVLVFEMLLVHDAGGAPLHVATSVLSTVFVGGGLALFASGLLILAIGRFWIPEFLQNGVVLALVMIVFAVSNHVQPESGLFAVTVMGIALANQRYADVRHVLEFKENLRVLLISALFIVLAARVSTDDLTKLGWSGIWFVASLVLIARPLAVAVSTIGAKLKLRERIFLACVAPRGIVAAAVAAVFAFRLDHAVEAGHADIAGAEQLVPLTFVTIVGTVLIYGLGAGFVAKWLGLADPNPQGVLIVGAHKLAREIGKLLKKHGLRVLLVDTNYDAIRRARMEEMTAYHGNVLGENTLEDIDLGGIGRLLALTPNNSVNMLAVQRFAPLFGRADSFQLATGEEENGKRKTAKHLSGRQLFDKEATYWTLQARMAGGEVIKATKLSESFTFESFRNEYGDDAVPMFVITESGRLQVFATDLELSPKAGQTLVSLVKPKPESSKKSEKAANGAADSAAAPTA